MTHLRQIMLEELERRNYAPGTIRSYIRTVEQFAQHFRCSPDKLGLDHIRQYQAEMFRTWKLAPNTVTQRLAALRFLYIQVLKRGWSAAETPYPKKVLHLPEILSQQEVARLIDATETPFQRILVMTLYAMVLDSTPLPELPPQLGQHPRQHLRTSGEPLREHHRRNRLVPREQRRGRPDTAHAPWPSAAACGLYRTVAITRPPNSAIIKSSSIRAAIPDLTFDGEARKASDKPSDNGPG